MGTHHRLMGIQPTVEISRKRRIRATFSSCRSCGLVSRSPTSPVKRSVSASVSSRRAPLGFCCSSPALAQALQYSFSNVFNFWLDLVTNGNHTIVGLKKVIAVVGFDQQAAGSTFRADTPVNLIPFSSPPM